MGWTQLKVTGKTEDRELICAVMDVLDPQLMIEDYSDIDMKGVYADLIDESIVEADKTVVSVSLFVPEDRSAAEYASYLHERFHFLGISVGITFSGVDEEEWATAWRRFYHPSKIGSRLVVVPTWESYSPAPGELVLSMDPGMAFGTGTHETTKLCSRLLEKNIRPGDAVLDLGTGSGILAICASLLGAAHCSAYDIDPVSVSVAEENIRRNGISNISCGVSDLLRDVNAQSGPFRVIIANIVADVINRLADSIDPFLSSDGVMIASGIIRERGDEVRRKYEESGFRVVDCLADGGWVAFSFAKK
ncbi:MAG: 50S ribosomal protein L11 methyltransferase [Clostridia bacterium]|nr:50S ribosomal protein L11 methyltransferase [Clostridia bacterium]